MSDENAEVQCSICGKKQTICPEVTREDLEDEGWLFRPRVICDECVRRVGSEVDDGD